MLIFHLLKMKLKQPFLMGKPTCSFRLQLLKKYSDLA